jgi:hypothetical protein
MSAISTALWGVVALIHLMPVTGVLGGERLQALYGLRVDEPSLSILLRHRAVLFAIVGGVLLAAAVHPPWRGLALVVGLVSVGSFLLLAHLEGGGNAALHRVVRIDALALAALLTVAAIDGLTWLRSP